MKNLDGTTFIPQELKTIEIDVEKKIFRINGEDIGKNCTWLSVICDLRDPDERLRVSAEVSGPMKKESFVNYDIDGKKTSKEEVTGR